MFDCLCEGESFSGLLKEKIYRWIIFYLGANHGFALFMSKLIPVGWLKWLILSRGTIKHFLKFPICSGWKQNPNPIKTR